MYERHLYSLTSNLLFENSCYDEWKAEKFMGLTERFDEISRENF